MVSPEPRRVNSVRRPGDMTAEEIGPDEMRRRWEARQQARGTQIENRLTRVESTAQRVEGSAGRADALLVAFAARRAVDRGVALGYLEPLLLDRFGGDRGVLNTVVVAPCFLLAVSLYSRRR
mgnify:CR=1 FL=1